jgi:glycosyltransferase involved in cell wall biosynthesis
MKMNAITNTDFGISIVFPVYFPEASVHGLILLRRALESIVDQRFPGPFEILAIDDSPKPAVELFDLVGRSLTDRIRWIRPHRNNGLVAALNVGLREAQYPLIARLDADDRWCPGKIEKQMSLFAKDPDLSIVATGMSLVDPAGKIFQRHIRPGDWKGILRFFVEVGCPFPHGSIVARKDIFQLLGGYSHDPLTSHCEDFALWGVWLRFFKPAMIEELLYEYTVSPTAKSAVNASALAQATGVVLDTFTRLNLSDRLPSALSSLANILGISLLQAGVLAYRLWHYRIAVRLPLDAIAPLRIILCDKNVCVVDEGREDTRDLGEALSGFVPPGETVPSPHHTSAADRSAVRSVVWVN